MLALRTGDQRCGEEREAARVGGSGADRHLSEHVREDHWEGRHNDQDTTTAVRSDNQRAW